MLPFGGQGSNQAIEDGGALGMILANVDDQTLLASRLSTFETLRRDRASRVQILSNVRGGKEHLVEREVRKYTGPPTHGKSILSPGYLGMSHKLKSEKLN